MNFNVEVDQNMPDLIIPIMYNVVVYEFPHRELMDLKYNT